MFCSVLFLSHSYGEIAPRHRSSGSFDAYPLSSTIIPEGTPGSYPLSSTVIPDHVARDGRVMEGVAESEAIGSGRGASNSPDGRHPRVGVNSLDQQTSGLSSSLTLSPSNTLTADDLCTLTLTEVSQNSMLLATAESIGGESTLVETSVGIVPTPNTECQVTETAKEVAAQDVTKPGMDMNERVQERVKYAEFQSAQTAGVLQAAGVQTAGVQAAGVQATGAQAPGAQVVKKSKDVGAATSDVAEVIGSTDVHRDKPSQSPPLVTKEDISQIVRREIEPILQVIT